jgi:hypothetical protein
MYLQKVISRKNCVKKLVFWWHLEGPWRKYQDPDPLVRGMDPRIRIHPKMSWIRNTGGSRSISESGSTTATQNNADPCGTGSGSTYGSTTLHTTTRRANTELRRTKTSLHRTLNLETPHSKLSHATPKNSHIVSKLLGTVAGSWNFLLLTRRKVMWQAAQRTGLCFYR